MKRNSLGRACTVTVLVPAWPGTAYGSTVSPRTEERIQESSLATTGAAKEAHSGPRRLKHLQPLVLLLFLASCQPAGHCLLNKFLRDCTLCILHYHYFTFHLTSLHIKRKESRVKNSCYLPFVSLLFCHFAIVQPTKALAAWLTVPSLVDL